MDCASPKTPKPASALRFPRNSPAPSRALPSRKSSLGCSRSTTRSVPARPATDWASNCSSTRPWWSPIPICHCVTAPWRLGPIRHRNTTCKPWKASPRHSAPTSIRRGDVCRCRYKMPSWQEPAIWKSAFATMTVREPMTPTRCSRASFPIWSAATAPPTHPGCARSCPAFNPQPPVRFAVVRVLNRKRWP